VDYLSTTEPQDELTDEQAAELQRQLEEHLGHGQEEVVREAAESPAMIKSALNQLSNVTQDEDGPVSAVLGPVLTDKIFDAMGELPEGEIELVIPLMAALGEANVQSLAEDGEPLPQDEQGYPILPKADQEFLGLSDEQVKRLTPIAMLIATLSGLYVGWPSMLATIDQE
jgi:hypothetical protein